MKACPKTAKSTSFFLVEDCEVNTTPKLDLTDFAWILSPAPRLFSIVGYYCTGAYVVLSALIAANGLKIRRISGASAGAWCAVFVACGLHPLDWVDTYYESKGCSDLALLDGYRSFYKSMMLKTLPSGT